MYCKRCEGLLLNKNCELFDKIVLPVPLHGAEIWDYEYCANIKTVHITSHRRILSVGSCTLEKTIMRKIGKYLVAFYYYFSW